MQQQFPQQNSGQEQRYDSAQVQRIVEIATRLQHEHHETMTTAQVEQLGADLGLSPDFIRAALKLSEIPSPTITQAATTEEPLFEMRPLTRRSLQQVFVVVAAYGLLVGLSLFTFTVLFARTYPNVWTGMMTLGCLVIPALAALFVGGWSRRLRTGALGGFLLGVVATLLAALLTTLRQGYPGGEFVTIGLILMCMGAVLGTVAAVVRRWWERLPHTDETRRTAR